MSAARDWRALYPFESHELFIGGLRYHYVNEGRGPVLLLVHGNPTWSFYWRELIRGLRDRFRVIAVDHIGCGFSEKPSPADYPYRLSRRIADLGQLVEQLNLTRITLVAHDWGGAIGMGAAAATPSRFSRFVLMNTAAFRAPRCPWPIRLCHTPLLGQAAIQGLNLFARAATRLTVCKPERITPAVRAGYLAPYDTWANRAAVYRFVCDIPLGPKHPSYATLVEVEQSLSQFANHPICLIWGMRDWCFSPWFLQRFLDFFPTAEVHRLADAGHYVVEDAHERIIPVVKSFLDKHPLE